MAFLTAFPSHGMHPEAPAPSHGTQGATWPPHGAEVQGLCWQGCIGMPGILSLHKLAIQQLPLSCPLPVMQARALTISVAVAKGSLPLLKHKC